MSCGAFGRMIEETGAIFLHKEIFQGKVALQTRNGNEKYEKDNLDPKHLPFMDH